MGKEESKERDETEEQTSVNPKVTALHSVGKEATRDISKQENDKVAFTFSDSQMQK